MKCNIVIVLVFLWVAIILSKTINESSHHSRNRLNDGHHRQSALHHRHRVRNQKNGSHSEHDEEKKKRENGEHGHSGRGYRVHEKVLNDVAPPKYHSRNGLLSIIGPLQDSFHGFQNNAFARFGCLNEIFTNITRTIIEELGKNPMDKRTITFLVEDRVALTTTIENGRISCRNDSNQMNEVEQGLDLLLGSNAHRSNL